MYAVGEERTERRNSLPSPPSRHKNYTAYNLKLLLREGAKLEGIDLSNVNHQAQLSTFEVLAVRTYRKCLRAHLVAHLSGQT